MGKSKNYGMNTKALHANKKFEPVTGDIMPPLHLSTTYKNDIPGESEYFYGRVNNPTRELFERTLAHRCNRLLNKPRTNLKQTRNHPRANLGQSPNDL